MTDLVEFLRARLDEDEQVARAAARVTGDANWTSGELGDCIYAGDSGSYVVVGPYDYLADELKAYFVMNDPKRVLAEVEAKRQIIKMWEDPASVRTLPEGIRDGRDPDEVEVQVAIAEVVDDMVCVLALPYAAHPDYDPAWTITTEAAT